MTDILGISTETEHAKRFVCLTSSGRGTVVIKCRFYGEIWSKNPVADGGCRKKRPVIKIYGRTQDDCLFIFKNQFKKSYWLINKIQKI
jgi:hypothetical protein